METSTPKSQKLPNKIGSRLPVFDFGKIILEAIVFPCSRDIKYRCLLNIEEKNPSSDTPYSILISDSEVPGLVSERPGTGPRGPWTWSQKVLELSLRSIRSEPIFKGPGLVLEDLRQVFKGSNQDWPQRALDRSHRALDRRTQDRSHRALDRRTQDRSHRALDRVSECSRSQRVLNWSQNDLDWSLTGEGPVDRSQMDLHPDSNIML